MFLNLCRILVFLTKWIFLPGITVKALSKLTMGWCKSNTCMQGKTVLVTGGNSGLGYQTALVLAGRGAKVIIADKSDTAKSCETIIESTNNRHVKGKFLDLSSFASVRKFADEFKKEENRLDVLINNAGIGTESNAQTEDGFPLQVQVNHLGPFLLTHLLIDELKASAPSRIVFVSSIAAFVGNLTLDSLNFGRDEKSESGNVLNYIKSYGNTKLLNLITSNVLAQKLRGHGVTSNAVHPGLVVTSIYRKLFGPDVSPLFVSLSYKILQLIGKDTYEGAQTQINCAISKDLEKVTGQYFVDCKPFYQPKRARDKEFCRKVWKRSEELVKLRIYEKL